MSQSTKLATNGNQEEDRKAVDKPRITLHVDLGD